MQAAVSPSFRNVLWLRDGLLLPAGEGPTEDRSWASIQRKERSRSSLSLTLTGPDGALRIAKFKSIHFAHGLYSA